MPQRPDLEVPGADPGATAADGASTEATAPGPLTLICMPQDLLFPGLEPGVRGLVDVLRGRLSRH
jgi:hypothetical protein